MASKATITMATVNTKTNTCYVTYSTGTEKMYPADKLPKTVAAWLADHEEPAADENEATKQDPAADEPVEVSTKAVETQADDTRATDEGKAENEGDMRNTKADLRNTKADLRNANDSKADEPTEGNPTEEAIQTGEDPAGDALAGLADKGKAIVEAAKPFLLSAGRGASLAAVALTMAVADLLRVLLPVLADIALAFASWTWGFVGDVLPVWYHDRAKPTVVHLGKEAVKAAAIAWYMVSIAMA